MYDSETNFTQHTKIRIPHYAVRETISMNLILEYHHDHRLRALKMNTEEEVF